MKIYEASCTNADCGNLSYSRKNKPKACGVCQPIKKENKVLSLGKALEIHIGFLQSPAKTREVSNASTNIA